MVRLGEVHAPVMHQRGEALEFLIRRPLAFLHFAEALLQPFAIALIRHLVTGHGQNAAVLGQLAVAERLEQGRHELAPGQVTGATKKDKIEGHVRGAPAKERDSWLTS